MLRKAGYTFTFLSDPKLETIRRYDLVHAKELASGKDISRPAELLLDTSGTVRWRMVTENLFVRARPEQVLEAAKSLPLSDFSRGTNYVRSRPALESWAY